MKLHWLSFRFEDISLTNKKKMLIIESINAQTTGAKVQSTSDNLRRTSYTDAGTDRTFGTTDDVTTTYLFNNAGLTVNAQSEDKDGSLLGVTANLHRYTWWKVWPVQCPEIPRVLL